MVSTKGEKDSLSILMQISEPCFERKALLAADIPFDAADSESAHGADIGT